MSINDDNDITPQDIIKNAEKLCNINGDYLLSEIKLSTKYNCLQYIANYLLSISITKHIEKHSEILEKYINDNIYAEELDDNSNDILDGIYHNYYGYLLTKHTNDETKRKEYTHKLVDILEKKFNRTKSYVVGLDYII